MEPIGPVRHSNATLGRRAMPSDQARNRDADYVALCRRHVAEQRRRIVRLEKQGWSTARARHFLETFEFSLSVATEVSGRKGEIGKIERGTPA